MVGNVSSGLQHPGFTRVRGETNQMFSPCCQFHEEQQVISDQPAFGPDHDRGEVNGGQHIPVCLEEALPDRPPAPIGCRFDAVRLQNVADRVVRNGVSKVCQGSLDAVIALGRILLCHLRHEFNDLLCHGWTPGAPASMAIVQVPGNEFAMPGQEFSSQSLAVRLSFFTSRPPQTISYLRTGISRLCPERALQTRDDSNPSPACWPRPRIHR